MTKQQAKKIFLIFSILLTLELLILPILFSVVLGNYSCEYSIPVCILLAPSLLLIIGFFWCGFWHTNFVVFFPESESDGRESKNFLIRLNIRNIKYNYSPNRPEARKSLIIITTILCVCITLLFFLEIFKFVALFLTQIGH